MILNNYDEPDEHELETAFRAVYHFIQKFSLPEKILVLLICKIMGDRLWTLVAKEMHKSTMQTLQNASCGVHDEFFKRKRKERAMIKLKTKDFVKSEFVE